MSEKEGTEIEAHRNLGVTGLRAGPVLPGPAFAHHAPGIIPCPLGEGTPIIPAERNLGRGGPPPFPQDQLKYRYGILLLLLRETGKTNPSLQVCDIQRRLEFLYGRVRKATILSNLRELYNSCKIDSSRKMVERKKLRRGSSPFYSRRALDMFPGAAAIISKEDNREDAGNNFSEGKYEVYVKLDTSLSQGYISFLKHEIARFFGFHNWYGGIEKEQDTPLKSYARIRASYSSLEASRFRQKLKEDAAARARERRKELLPLYRFGGPHEEGRGCSESSPRQAITQEVCPPTDRGRTVPTA